MATDEVDPTVHRRFGQAMRDVFAHYATIEIASTHLCDWAHCEEVSELGEFRSGSANTRRHQY
eukprot:8121529-Pyramimonas_sp.AAC.1